MDNITKINDIKYLIMEFYSDQEPLTEEQQKSKERIIKGNWEK